MKNKNRLIDIKALITRVLYFWRLIVLLTLVFALLGAGRSFMNQKGQIAKAKETQEKVKKESENNEEDVDLTFSEELKTIDEQLAYRQDFLRNAPIMRVNPFKAYVVTTRYRIQQTKSEEDTDLVVSENSSTENQNVDDSVTELITMVYDRYVDWEAIGKEINEDYYYYIKDSIGINKAGDIYRISVIYDDKESANVIMDHVEEAVSKGLAEYQDSTGLSATLLGRDSINTMSFDRSQLTANKIEQLNRLMTARNNLVNNADIVNKNGVRTASGNVKTTISKKDLIKAAIKFGILGGALSLVIALGKILLGNKVLSAQELYDNYEMKKLYAQPILPTKKGKIDQLINQIMNGKNAKVDEVEKMKLCAMDIEELSKNKEIVLVSDSSKEEVDQLKKDLNLDSSIQLTPCLDPVNNSADRKVLNSAKETIVFVKQGQSSYTTLNEIMDLISNKEIQILGSICK